MTQTNQKKAQTGQDKIYQMVTDTILEKLEAGVIPWKQGWKNYGSMGCPANLISGKPYRGINVMLLNIQGYQNPYWLTFKQCKQVKGHVKKGEKSTTIIFWKFTRSTRTETNEETGESETKHVTIPLLRYYRVFNVEQCEGIDHKRLRELQESSKDEEFDPIEAAENIWLNYQDKPNLTHNESKAYYRPSTDSINMPRRSAFETSEGYYSVLFHEATHSTGSKFRLNREGIINFTGFGSGVYGKEELCAEMGAAYLAATAGIEAVTLDDSASYIDNWMKAIQADHKLVIQAAAQAQHATDYILGIRNPEAE